MFLEDSGKLRDPVSKKLCTPLLLSSPFFKGDKATRFSSLWSVFGNVIVVIF
jgi:hypothetical protein